MAPAADLSSAQDDLSRLAKRRETILHGLQEAQKSAAAPVQPVLQKMHALLTATHPNLPYNAALDKGLTQAFKDLLSAAGSAKEAFELPSVLAEGNQLLGDYAAWLKARSLEQLDKAGVEVPEELRRDPPSPVLDTISREKAPDTAVKLGNPYAAPKQASAPATEPKADAPKRIDPRLGHIDSK